MEHTSDTNADPLVRRWVRSLTRWLVLWITPLPQGQSQDLWDAFRRQEAVYGCSLYDELCRTGFTEQAVVQELERLSEEALRASLAEVCWPTLHRIFETSLRPPAQGKADTRAGYLQNVVQIWLMREASEAESAHA